LSKLKYIADDCGLGGARARYTKLALFIFESTW
jgi:hypothetical protein